MPPASILGVGTLGPIQIWRSRAVVTTAGTWTDVSWKSSPSLNIDLRLLRPLKLWSQFQVSRISDGTFERPTGNYIASPQTGLLRIFHLLTAVVLMRHTRNSAMPSLPQQKHQSRAVVETTIDHAGMRSVRHCTRPSLKHRWARHPARQLLACWPGSMTSEGIAGQKSLTTSTLHTPAGLHGVPFTT